MSVMSIVESGSISLAFRLRVVGNFEYRGQQSGISGKTQKQWLSLLLEDQDTQQLSISVPTEMIRDVYDMHLRKGDIVHVSFIAVARADGNSYIMLDALPALINDGEEGDY